MEDLDKALLQAKMGIVRKSAFWSTICFGLKHAFIIDPEIPRAGTDGTSIFYNPDFFMGLTKEERIFVIAHELGHVALSHMTRRGNRDHKKFNYAGDFKINYMLHAEGYCLINDILYDEKYDHTWTTEAIYDDLPDPKNNEPGGLGLDILDPKGKHSQGKNEQTVDLEIKALLARAITQSKMAKEYGNLPGDIRAEFDDLLSPKLTWYELLSNYVDGFIKEDYSWRRPNKKFLPHFYLPTAYSERLANLTIGVDTSASISKEDITKMVSELNTIKEEFKPELLTVIDCDTKIHAIHELTNDMDIRELYFTGRGGTSFQPVFDYCEDNVPVCLIYFTDLYSDFPPEPDYPVIWVNIDNDREAPYGVTIHYER